MPIHTNETVKHEVFDGVNNPCGTGEALRFSESGGLTQFGAFVEVLPPGSSSSVKHWHEVEDEMVYMLEGMATLHEGDKTAILRAGEAATFKAGEPAGHCLVNTSDKTARYLVIGTRASRETVTYPDDDRVLIVDRAQQTHRYTTLSGEPASSPYTLET